MKKIILSSITITILSFFIFHTVAAQTPSTSPVQAVEISPPTQELDVKPGDSLTKKIKIRNINQEELKVNVRIDDFIPKGEEGQVELVEKGPWSARNWIKVTPKEFELKPKEEQEVTVELTIPSTNIAGGHYSSVVFSIIGIGDSNNVGISQEIGSLLLINVSGQVKENLILESFTAHPFYEHSPINMELKFHNNGNVHVKAAGLINVTDMFGNKVQDVVIPANNVFPEAKRIVKAELEKKWLIGQYKGLAIVYYGSENKTIRQEISFFVFPWKLGIIIGFILFILIKGRKRLGKALHALFGK